MPFPDAAQKSTEKAQDGVGKQIALVVCGTFGGGRRACGVESAPRRRPHPGSGVPSRQPPFTSWRNMDPPSRLAPLRRDQAVVWRDGRVVDGGGLENRCTRKGTGGSNPSPSDLRHTLASLAATVGRPDEPHARFARGYSRQAARARPGEGGPLDLRRRTETVLRRGAGWIADRDVLCRREVHGAS